MWTLSRDVLENLLNHGFDIDLIAFEFGVPKEKLELYKKEFEKNNLLIKRRNSNLERAFSTSKIDGLRRKYYLFIGSNQEKNSAFLQVSDVTSSTSKILPTPEEIEMNNIVLNSINTLLIDGDSKNPSEKRQIAKEAYAEYKKINVEKLTFEQIVELNKILENDVLNSFPLFSANDGLGRVYEYSRRKVIKILCDEMAKLMTATDSLEELEELRKIASSLSDRDNKIAVDMIRGRISEKIRMIKTKRMTDEIKIISPKVMEIVNKLLMGNANIEEIKKIIEEEALKTCKEKKSNGFIQYTVSSAKNRICQQIHALIRENAEQYPIENIEELVSDLRELTGRDEEACVKTVIANLAQRKEYQRAQFVCEMYKGDDKKSDTYKSFQTIKQSVQRMEVGDAVLNLISGGTREEEKRWLAKIESMSTKGIKPELVQLGKAPNGKDIKLSDILTDEINV